MNYICITDDELGALTENAAVNNPATDTVQTVMAAVAGFGIGFMVRGARQED